MPGISGTDVGIVGRFFLTACVSRHGIHDALGMLKYRLNAPETATGEYGRIRRISGLCYKIACRRRDFNRRFGDGSAHRIRTGNDHCHCRHQVRPLVDQRSNWL